MLSYTAYGYTVEFPACTLIPPCTLQLGPFQTRVRSNLGVHSPLSTSPSLSITWNGGTILSLVTQRPRASPGFQHQIPPWPKLWACSHQSRVLSFSESHRSRDAKDVRTVGDLWIVLSTLVSQRDPLPFSPGLQLAESRRLSDNIGHGYNFKIFHYRSHSHPTFEPVSGFSAKSFLSSTSNYFPSF